MSPWRRFFGRPARHAPGDEVVAFRASLETWLATGTAGDLRAAIARAAAVEAPDELELEVERLQARLEALDLGERLSQGHWPTIATQHKAAGDDVCHEIAPVSVVGPERERPATLLVTSRRVVIVGTPLLHASWNAVTSCRLEARDVLLGFKGQSHRIRCATHVTAERVSVLATALRAKAASASP
jgi:hypothetical protein